MSTPGPTPEILLPLALEAPRPVRLRVGPSASTLRTTLESLADAHRDAVEQFAVTANTHEAVGNTVSAAHYRHSAFNVRADLDRLERIIEREIEGVYDEPLPHDDPHDEPHDLEPDDEPVEPIDETKHSERRVTHHHPHP